MNAEPVAFYDWNVTALEGSIFSMSQIRGEPFLLNIWSTMCPPCIAELPSIERLHRAVSGDGVRVLCVATDGDADRVRRLVAENGWQFPVYVLGPSEIPQVFDLWGTKGKRIRDRSAHPDGRNNRRAWTVAQLAVHRQANFKSLFPLQCYCPRGSGVYIVIAQRGVPAHPFQLAELVRRAYLHLSKVFRSAGVEMIVVNVADVFGFVCSAVGATDVASGPSNSMRRLNLSAFRDEQFGIAVPQYYAHRVIGEFKTENDLNRLVEARLLRRVADETPLQRGPARDTARGANGGGPAPPGRKARTTSPRRRSTSYRALLLRERSSASSRSRSAKRSSATGLEDAEAGMLYLKERLNAPVIGTAAPAASWLEQLDAILE